MAFLSHAKLSKTGHHHSKFICV